MAFGLACTLLFPSILHEASGIASGSRPPCLPLEAFNVVHRLLTFLLPRVPSLIPAR
jgi:hypothetical protein